MYQVILLCSLLSKVKTEDFYLSDFSCSISSLAFSRSCLISLLAAVKRQFKQFMPHNLFIKLVPGIYLSLQ